MGAAHAAADDQTTAQLYSSLLPSFAHYRAGPVWASAATIAIEAIGALGDIEWLLETRQQRAIALDAAGSTQDAVDELAEVVEQARAHALYGLVARCEALLGQIARRRGRTEEAKARLLSAYRMYERVGDLLGQARSMGDLGNCLSDERDSTAEDVYVQAIDLFVRSNDLYGASRVLTDAALNAERDGRLSEGAGLRLVATGLFAALGRADIALSQRLLAATRTSDGTGTFPAWLDNSMRNLAVVLPRDERLIALKAAGQLLDEDDPSATLTEIDALPPSTKQSIESWISAIIDEATYRFGRSPTTEALEAVRARLTTEPSSATGTGWQLLTNLIPPRSLARALDDIVLDFMTGTARRTPTPSAEELARSSSGETRAALQLMAVIRETSDDVDGISLVLARELVATAEDALRRLTTPSPLRSIALQTVASLYRTRPILDERAEDLERSVSLNRLRLSEISAIGDTADIPPAKLNLANSLLDRHYGDRHQNLREALDNVDSVLATSQADQESILVGLALHTRGLVLSALDSDETDVLRCFTQAALLIPDGHPHRSQVLRSLGIAHLNRSGGDHGLNVEMASEYLDAAYNAAANEADRISILSPLGRAIELRRSGQAHANAAAALACSIECARYYLLVDDYRELAGALNNLGATLQQTAARGLTDPAKALDQASRCLTTALSLRRGDPTAAQSAHNLGIVLGNPEHPHHDASMAQALLRQAMRERRMNGSAVAAGESAVEAALLSSALGDEGIPSDVRDVMRDPECVPEGTWSRVRSLWMLGDKEARKQRWEAAASILSDAADSFESMYLRAVLSTTRTEMLTDATTLAAGTAYALVSAGRHAEAALVLERSRARALGDLAERARHATARLRDTRPDLAARLAEIAEGERQLWQPGSGWVAYQTGRRAALNREGSAMSVGPLPVDAASQGRRQRRIVADLRELVSEIREVEGFSDFFEASSLNRLETSAATVGSVTTYIACSEYGVVAVKVGTDHEGLLTADGVVRAQPDLAWLWQELLGSDSSSPMLLLQDSDDKEILEHAAREVAEACRPFAEILISMGDGLHDSDEAITIVPCGLLGILPLSSSQSDDGRYLLIESALTYFPSLRIASTLRPVEELGKDRIGVIADATEDLAGALEEGHAVANIYNTNELLEGSNAVREAAIDMFERIDTLHFASHATFDHDNPMMSGLELHDGRITSADLVRERVRLPLRVILSACQTALYDFLRAPDEYTGLLTAFLASGSSQVVATLWPVMDIPTLFMMLRLHEELRADGSSTASALAAARAWLASARKAELLEAATRWVGSDVANQLGLSRYDDADRPYASPYYWSAFVAVGR